MVSKIRNDRQDSDRPHFYSQFWIDVATGKTTPSPAETESVEEADGDLDEDILALAPKAEPKAKAAKPAEKKPEARPTITSLADLANIDMLMKSSAAMDDDEAPDIAAGLDASASPDITLDVVEGGANTFSDEDEAFEEEEEDEEWGGGRRKPKPGKTKRHERRDF
ncbi:MAG TPA: hypothetical protein VF808_17245 [Ktedonobacterales bacterium]